MTRRIAPIAILALAGVGLAGCTSSGSSEPSGAATSSAEVMEPLATTSAPVVSPSASSGQAQGYDITVADSPLGEIVVDGKGMTAYYYDQDTANSGISACTGGCLAAWPPILSATDTPTVEGVTGQVAVIPTPDGTYQITINGMPIYTYADDQKPGDVNGQGVGGVWWAVAPNGDKITTSGSAS